MLAKSINYNNELKILMKQDILNHNCYKDTMDLIIIPLKNM